MADFNNPKLDRVVIEYIKIRHPPYYIPRYGNDEFNELRGLVVLSAEPIVLYGQYVGVK